MPCGRSIYCMLVVKLKIEIMPKKLTLSALLLGLIFYAISISTGCKTNGEKDEAGDDPVFEKVASSSSGISFNNMVDENYQKNYFDSFAYVYNGAGVATGDFNNDGLIDIYFTGNEVSDKLYINKGGMKFTDMTETAGVAGNKGWKN